MYFVSSLDICGLLTDFVFIVFVNFEISQIIFLSVGLHYPFPRLHYIIHNPVNVLLLIEFVEFNRIDEREAHPQAGVETVQKFFRRFAELDVLHVIHHGHVPVRAKKNPRLQMRMGLDGFLEMLAETRFTKRRRNVRI